MESTLYAVDIAKNVFQVAVSPAVGKVSSEHRLTRAKFLPFFGKRRPATVLMETCGTSHHWARQLSDETRPTVPTPEHCSTPSVIPTFDQFRSRLAIKQTLTALHRLRSAWVAQRTARVNNVRGLLRELGFFIPKGRRHVAPKVWDLVENADSGLPEPLRQPIAESVLEIQELHERVLAVERQLKAIGREDPIVKRLLTVPGIGIITATAMVALIGDVFRFPTARHFASFLGLTPNERSSGEVRRLGHISKRGDQYLRSLLVHGARSVLWTAKRYDEHDALRSWALKIQKHKGHNKAAVALANKIARIAWACWKTGTDFQSKAPKH